MCYTAAVTCIYLLIIYNSFTFFSDNRCVYDGRDPFNQNFWKFRSKTQWIGSVQAEKFWKNWSTNWSFEVGQFSRSDWSEFWLNGSRPISPYKALMSKRAKSYPLFHLDLRGHKLICTINMTLWSVKDCGPERLFATKSLRQLSCFFIFFLHYSLLNVCLVQTKGIIVWVYN